MGCAAGLLPNAVEAVWSRLPAQYDFDSKAVPGQRQTLSLKSFDTQRLVPVRVQEMDGNEVFHIEALADFIQDELHSSSLGPALITG